MQNCRFSPRVPSSMTPLALVPVPTNDNCPSALALPFLIDRQGPDGAIGTVRATNGNAPTVVYDTLTRVRTCPSHEGLFSFSRT
jgi:hypothetical protein